MHTKRSSTRLVVAVMAVLGLFGLGLAPTANADTSPANHGWCNNWRVFYSDLYHYAHVPSIGTTGTTHCNMNRGAYGNAVRALQLGLKYCHGKWLGTGGPNGDGVDGDYGGLTEAAVRSVQEDYKIGVDGKYGPQTRGVMWWAEFNGGSRTGYCLKWSSYP